MSRNKYAVARRSLWYFLRILLLLVVLVTLVLGVFVTGLYTSNIYIILQDGMNLRAQCILQEGATGDLVEYFSEDWIARDAALTADTYADFTVSGYDYRLEVQKLLALPWQSKVKVRAIDKLASISATPNDQGENTLPPTLPDWPTTLCEITLVREKSRWYIDDVKTLETNPVEEPLPTPDMQLAGAAQE